MDSDLVFLKLGGSLITDKASAYTPCPGVIERLAREIQGAREQRADLQLLLGHGSGSFGHRAAAPYGTQRGVRTEREWRGFAEVATAAARLNRIVTDALAAAGVPVLSLQPSASARCENGRLTHLEINPLRQALARGLVPLVYGDVALDSVRGGTIVSTEDLFVYLASALRPQRILLAGNPPGVLGTDGHVVPRITPATVSHLDAALRGAQETDVTGGMAAKVALMIGLVEELEDLTVHILTGTEPGLVQRALVDPGFAAGTRISAS
jgi:isopentenyl phosphate kinase